MRDVVEEIMNSQEYKEECEAIDRMSLDELREYVKKLDDDMLHDSFPDDDAGDMAVSMWINRARERIDKLTMLGSKIYTKIIKNNCHCCPACHAAQGQGHYYCDKTSVTLGYDDDHITIPSSCPLKDFIE